MNRFVKRLFYFTFIGLIPIIGILSSYLYFDPFKVLKNYNDYSYPFVIPNRDYISTTMFIKNHKKYNYNSFVFGSSRTLAFRPTSWEKYLRIDDIPFMFDASGESIYGIYTKLNYLDSTKVKIDNVLIILCRDISFKNSENQSEHLFIKHPITSGESNLSFQLVFLKAYLSPKFLYNFFGYKIIGHYQPFMSGYIENRKINFDSITNEINIIDQETELNQNPTEYYLKRKNLFYLRNEEKIDTVQRISNKQVSMLNEIKRILEKNNSTYKIVLSPLYEQIKFSNSDIRILRNIFGNCLFDFSGKNKYTIPISNYYETSHYRSHVGDSILNTIYN